MLFGKKPKPQSMPEEPVVPVQDQSPEEKQPPSQEDSAVLERPVEAEKLESESAHSQEDVGEGSMNESDLTASVSRNTVFKGDITTQDNLDIYGTVEGSIVSSAVVRVYGTVQGDIACVVLVANGSEITGGVLAEKSVVIGNGAKVKGDVHAVSVSISGWVDGDITATESAVIGGESRVSGDITTAELEMSKGAIVNGGLKMEKPKKEIVEEPKPEPETTVDEEPKDHQNEEDSSVFPLPIIEPVSDEDTKTPLL